MINDVLKTTDLEKKYAASPLSVLFAIDIASASSLNLMIAATGPNISSSQHAMFSVIPQNKTVNASLGRF